MKIDVYSDGSGQTAGTAGGYGWVLVIDGVKHSEGSGHSPNATNNDMELEGAIQGLKAAKSFVDNSWSKNIGIVPNTTLISDSEIVLGWASGRYRFKQEHKLDRYKELIFYMDKLNAKTQWVKGHSGDTYNTRCDKLANEARKGSIEIDKDISLSDTKIGTKKTGVVALWYLGQLKIIDFDQGIIENYNRGSHGKRGSLIEIREDKSR